tara:strand:- start:431 stop:1015 length:585 start_codon:yes stop_codon:yes gene_type:complete
MANLFDAANAPNGEPEEIVVGDFSQWKRSDLVEDYPVATHSAEYVMRITGGGSSEHKLAATENADYYLFTLDSSTSATFDAGKYHWQLEITQTSSGNRIVVDAGDFQFLPDMDNNQADPRIHAEIMVAKIESLLQGKADADVSNYSIAGRSLTKMSFTELTDARDYYRQEITKHENDALLKRGKRNGATIRARF